MFRKMKTYFEENLESIALGLAILNSENNIPCMM